MDKVKTRIESWRNLAEILLNENKQVFIKDYSDNYYIGDIILVGENTITIFCIAPEQRANKNHVIYWASIEKFEEKKEDGK